MAGPARRQYTDAEKAQALAVLDAFGGEIQPASKALAIPDSTLESWRDGRGLNKGIPALREDKRIELASKLDQIAMKAAGLALEKVDAASVRDLMGAIKISTEMGQLLRNQPTSITETRNLTADERNSRIAEILGQATRRASMATPESSGTSRTN